MTKSCESTELTLSESKSYGNAVVNLTSRKRGEKRGTPFKSIIQEFECPNWWGWSVILVAEEWAAYNQNHGGWNEISFDGVCE
jgi:hypothetical protein